jgi:hypothetical protein
MEHEPIGLSECFQQREIRPVIFDDLSLVSFAVMFTE